LTKKREKETV